MSEESLILLVYEGAVFWIGGLRLEGIGVILGFKGVWRGKIEGAEFKREEVGIESGRGLKLGIWVEFDLGIWIVDFGEIR